MTKPKYDKFTKRVTQNKIAPKDGSAPLTVVEFSLTDPVRDSLKAALDEYRAGYGQRSITKDEKKLAEIIHNHFPPEILTELSTLAKKGGAPATVYVVHNLPEEQVPQHLVKDPAYGFGKPLTRWGQKAYVNLVGKGVAAALALVSSEEEFVLPKTAGDTKRDSFTESLHKHLEPVTMLAGVKTGGTETRFVDVAAVLDEAEHSNSDVSVHTDEAQQGQSMLLSKFRKMLPTWKDAANTKIIPVQDDENEMKFEALVDKHAQRLVIGPGDLAMWAEDNQLYHQAMPKVEAGPKGWLTRLMIGAAFNRPDEPQR